MFSDPLVVFPPSAVCVCKHCSTSKY